MKLFVVLTLQEQFESLDESIGIEVYQAASETDLWNHIRGQLVVAADVPAHEIESFMNDHFLIHEVQLIDIVK